MKHKFRMRQNAGGIKLDNRAQATSFVFNLKKCVCQINVWRLLQHVSVTNEAYL